MIGTGELIVILSLATLLFGGKKIPELAKNIGVGIREFKRALLEGNESCERIVKEEVIPEDPPEKNCTHDNKPK